MSKPFETPYNSTEELLLAVSKGEVKNEDIKKHLDAIEVKNRKELSVRRSKEKKDKSGELKISVYGLQKFPVTLSEESWLRACSEVPKLIAKMKKEEAEAAKAPAEAPAEAA